MNTWLHHEGFEYTDAIRAWNQNWHDGGLFDRERPDVALLPLLTAGLAEPEVIFPARWRDHARSRWQGRPSGTGGMRHRSPAFRTQLQRPPTLPSSIPFDDYASGDGAAQAHHYDELLTWDKPVHFVWGCADQIFTDTWGGVGGPAGRHVRPDRRREPFPPGHARTSGRPLHPGSDGEGPATTVALTAVPFATAIHESSRRQGRDHGSVTVPAARPWGSDVRPGAGSGVGVGPCRALLRTDPSLLRPLPTRAQSSTEPASALRRRASGPWHRSARATCPSTCSTCMPHPFQVGRPHSLHVTAAHIVVPLVESSAEPLSGVLSG